jgi:hypothetical protein
MATSSKGRGSSRKQSSAGKARVISTKRKDALPRTGGVSAGRRKPVVLPSIDALTEPPVAAVAVPAPAPKKKAHSRAHQKEPTATRKKTTRAAGRASATLDEPAAMEVAQAVAAAPETVEVAAPPPVAEMVPASVVEVPTLIASEIEQAIVTALEPVADTVGAVEPPAMEAAPAVPETVEVAAPAPVGEGSPASVVEAPALIEPAMVTASEPVADAVGAVEPPATPYEVFTVTALEAREVEALAVVETELEVEASAIVEELPFEAVTAPSVAIGPPPIPEETRAPQLFYATAARSAPAPAAPAVRAPHPERRSLMPAVSRLLSTLVRWTGVSGRK